MCGEAILAQKLPNEVYSFDHIAINEYGIPSDSMSVSLESASLDIAVFSLSLMGSNFKDYIKEAFRTLKLDGFLYIVEATSRFKNIDSFCKSLELMGFGVESPKQFGQFTLIRATKRIQDFNELVSISF